MSEVSLDLFPAKVQISGEIINPVRVFVIDGEALAFGNRAEKATLLARAKVTETSAPQAAREPYVLQTPAGDWRVFTLDGCNCGARAVLSRFDATQAEAAR